MKKFKNTLVYGQSSEDYFATNACNATLLKALNGSTPAKAMAAKDHKPSAAKEFGSLLHTRLLEPETYNDRYAVLELNLRTKADRETKANSEDLGIKIIKPEDYSRMLAIEESVRNHELASKYLSGGFSEVSVYWTEKESGARCKARFDKWQPRMNAIVDVKTCEDITDEGIAKAITNYFYFIQEGHYINAALAAATKFEPRFVFIFLETQAPFEVRVGELPIEIRRHAQELIKPLYKLYQNCVSKNEWPGYEKKLETFQLSSWKMRELSYMGVA